MPAAEGFCGDPPGVRAQYDLACRLRDGPRRDFLGAAARSQPMRAVRYRFILPTRILEVSLLSAPSTKMPV
jgi:hypothetical protein